MAADTGAAEHNAQGHQLCLAGQHAQAEACFRAAIRLQPGWALPHNNLAWALQAQGRNEEAVAGYQQALQLAPALELAQVNLAFLLANLYFFLGKWADARAMWLFLASHHPEDPHVLDNLISTALRLHDLADAGRWATRHAVATRTGAPAVPAPRLTRGKLQHDQAQYRYLQSQGLLGPAFDGVVQAYAEAIQRLDENKAAGADMTAAPAILNTIQNTYGRIVLHYPAKRIPGHAISMAGTSQQAEATYLNSRPGVVVIDDFLCPQALAELQRFCLESTVWHSNSYSHDRLGAFFRDGFNCPLLLQIAEELPQLFPQVIGKQHPLLQMWGYKYRHDQPATHPHADFAAVNVNFWITPDSANLDPASGGLVIYDVEAPLDWGFEAYNRQGDKIAAFLQASGAKSITIPYRCNRAVVFNSDLFHATAPLAFRPGYAQQRINVTMLYGEREFERKETVHMPSGAPGYPPSTSATNRQEG